MNRAISAVAAVLATVGLVAAATPALAENGDAQSITVSIVDLDLSTPEHRARLKARVGRAASKVCAGHDRDRPAALADWLVCWQHGVALEAAAQPPDDGDVAGGTAGTPGSRPSAEATTARNCFRSTGLVR